MPAGPPTGESTIEEIGFVRFKLILDVASGGGGRDPPLGKFTMI